MIRTWTSGEQGSFSTSTNWVGGVAPGTGDTAVIDSADGNPATNGDTLFSGGQMTSYAVFGPVPLPVDSATVYFTFAAGTPEVIDGITYDNPGYAYSLSYPVPLAPPTSGDVVLGQTIDFGNGNGSLTGAALEQTNFDAATTVNINGPSLWTAYFDNTRAGTINIGDAFSVAGTPVAQPTANVHGSLSELDLLLVGDGSVQAGAAGTLELSNYVPSTTNTGTINIASGSELRLNFQTGAEQAGQDASGTTRFVLFSGEAEFVNEGAIDIAPGGALLAYDGGSSDAFLLSQFVNNGNVLIQGGQGQTTGALVEAALSGTGTITVDGGNGNAADTVLHLNAVVASNIIVRDGTVLATDTGSGGNLDTAGSGQHRAIGGTLTFADGRGSLIVDTSTNSLFAGTTPYLAKAGTPYATPSLAFWDMPIYGLQAGDSIVANIVIPLQDTVLYSYAIAPLQWNAASHTAIIDEVVTDTFTSATTSVAVGAFQLEGAYTAANLVETVASGSGGYDFQVTITTTAPACFAAGTRIATARGPVRIEDLSVGDLVVTQEGDDRVLQPIVWIGLSRFDVTRHPNPNQVMPVRIRAGALAGGMPLRDLVVSPGHSLLIDGLLMQAERLINGATIVRDRATRHGIYFHIELERHAILFSEDAPSESYLDTGNRSAFFNAAGPIDLHPNFSARNWTQTCRPLILGGPCLAAARRRLVDRALALGWQRVVEPEPVLWVANRKLTGSRDGERWIFTLPEGTRSVRLGSPTAVPAEVLADPSDTRTLGLRVSEVAIRRNRRLQPLPFDDAALAGGWHEIEHDATGTWRWTDGNATLNVAGPCALELTIHSGMARWRPFREARARLVPECHARLTCGSPHLVA